MMRGMRQDVSSCAALVCLAAWWLASATSGWSAETTTPPRMTRTTVVLTLDTTETISAVPRMAQRPPSIVVEFPDRKVSGSLPDEQVVEQGAIQAIRTRYYPRAPRGGERFIQSVQIIMRAPFSSTVRNEPGRIIVEIEHPTSVRSGTMELALRNRTLITTGSRAGVSARFQAMQTALEYAAPVPITAGLPAAAAPTAAAPAPAMAPQSAGRSTDAPTSRIPKEFGWPWLAVAMLAAVMGWTIGRSARGRQGRLPAPSPEAAARLPSGIGLIDHLIWQAFEHGGFRLEKLIEVAQPRALLRLATKDDAPVAILFVWSGQFFEKRTVEQFLGILRDLQVTQGILVGSGAFTVPAQRLAEEHQIRLVGRDQVLELLGASAATEHFAQQLSEAHARLEAAKEAIRRSAAELETLRRQRNEASWYLGEERAKAVQAETQIAELQRQVTQYQADVQRWEDEALRLRRQWDESEWFLGEARSRMRYLETQLAGVEAMVARADQAERERDQANWHLGEERMARQALEARLQELTTSLSQASTRERTLEDTISHLREELASLIAERERRVSLRRPMPHVFVELWNGRKTATRPLYAGVPRDLSQQGFGLTTEEPLPRGRRLRMRLTVPGSEQPLESTVRLVWQRKDGRPARYRSGFVMPEPTDTLRSRLHDLLEVAG